MAINIQNIIDQITTKAAAADSSMNTDYLLSLSKAVLAMNNATGVIEYRAKSELPTVDSSILGNFAYIAASADLDSVYGDAYGAFFYAARIGSNDSGWDRIRTGVDSDAEASGGGPSVNGLLYTTTGTHTFTVPSGVSTVSVFCVGGGGAGDNGNNGDGGGGGGGGAACVWIEGLSVSSGQTYNIQVGAGGAADAFNTDEGDKANNGSQSFFKSSDNSEYIIANGGEGGDPYPDASGTPGGSYTSSITSWSSTGGVGGGAGGIGGSAYDGGGGGGGAGGKGGTGGNGYYAFSSYGVSSSATPSAGTYAGGGGGSFVATGGLGNNGGGDGGVGPGSNDTTGGGGGGGGAYALGIVTTTDGGAGSSTVAQGGDGGYPGGGGGGAGDNSNTGGYGSSGGDGVVIIRYNNTSILADASSETYTEV